MLQSFGIESVDADNRFHLRVTSPENPSQLNGVVSKKTATYFYWAGSAILGLEAVILGARF